MSDTELKPTNEGIMLIKSLISSQEIVERAQGSLLRYETDLKNSKQKIADWLVPKDAKIGQVFVLAVRKSFLHVEVIEGKKSWAEGTAVIVAAKDFKVSWKPFPPDRL